METTYVVLRDGVKKLMINGSVESDGTFRGRNGEVVIDSKLAGAMDASVQANLQARRYSEIPRDLCGKVGTSSTGLTIMIRAEYEAQRQAEVDRKHAEFLLSHPGHEERQAIKAMYEKAQRMYGNGGCSSVYALRAEADARLTAWAERFPLEAAEERSDVLRAKAEKLRELAAGAFTYDADGSLSRADQQARRDEMMAEAAELDLRAQEIFAK